MLQNHKRLLLLGGGALFIICGFVIILSTHALALRRASQSSCNKELPYTAEGLAAIHPRNDCTPSFTKDDVTNYVMTTHYNLGRIDVDGQPTITQISFLKRDQVSQLLAGESINVPDNDMVCYVQLMGIFSVIDPNNHKIVYHQAYEVFDAHTDNILEVGARR